jgi:myo-inositol-1(or 4)-monophosphatase
VPVSNDVTSNPTEYSELAALCAHTAHMVGERVLSWRRERGELDDDSVSTKSSPTDVVTEADRLAEKMIRERLMSARPDAAWWGEESGRDPGSGAAGGLEWVVDPIDGTTNFLYGLPGWSVSIAARIEGRTVAAAVHIPTWSETFTAELGGGAFLNDLRGRRQLTASAATDLSRALIATGFAYDEVVRSRQGPIVGHLVSRVRDIRRAGAASVDLCAVAASRVDAFFEHGLEPWDLAAGSLIAAEAGAKVYERASGTTVAVGPRLADSLDALLTELGD